MRYFGCVHPGEVLLSRSGTSMGSLPISSYARVIGGETLMLLSALFCNLQEDCCTRHCPIALRAERRSESSVSRHGVKDRVVDVELLVRELRAQIFSLLWETGYHQVRPWTPAIHSQKLRDSLVQRSDLEWVEIGHWTST